MATSQTRVFPIDRRASAVTWVGLSWTDAVASAHQKLAEERAAGFWSVVHTRSWLIDIVLRGRGCSRLVQHAVCVASSVSGFCTARALGFGVLSQIGFALSSLNIWLKILTTHVLDPFAQDDAPYFMLLRVLSRLPP
eukprot:3703049-Prymnesium_polylepis.1